MSENKINVGFEFLGGISWVAYFKTTLVYLIISTIVISPMVEFDVNTKYILVTGVVFVLFYVVQILGYKNNYLYMNDDGVWMHFGVFPWSKGVRGVSWQNLDGALYYLGFFSWLFRYNKVKLPHRFTKDSEIVIDFVHKGKNVVFRINDTLYKVNNS